MRKIKKNTKFDFNELYMCYTNSREKSKNGGFGYSSNATDVLILDGEQLIGCVFDDKGNPTLTYYSLGQVLSTREKEKSSIDGDQVDRYIEEIFKKEEYKDREFSYITDIQRFDKFLQQFGIDISKLEKVTLDEAKKIFRKYRYDGKREIIKNYLQWKNGTKIAFFAMSERRKENVMGEIIDAIKEGKYVITPEMLYLKKKSIFKRLLESITNKKDLLDSPKEDVTTNLGIQQQSTEKAGFVQKVEMPSIDTNNKKVEKRLEEPSEDGLNKE